MNLWFLGTSALVRDELNEPGQPERLGALLNASPLDFLG